MNVQDAFFFEKYGAWDYLNKHWWALHTDSEFWAVRVYMRCAITTEENDESLSRQLYQN